MDCTPCLRKECDRDQECGLSISVDTVYDLVVSHLQAIEKECKNTYK
jgi:hypothetical protein